MYVTWHLFCVVIGGRCSSNFSYPFCQSEYLSVLKVLSCEFSRYAKPSFWSIYYTFYTISLCIHFPFNHPLAMNSFLPLWRAKSLSILMLCIPVFIKVIDEHLELWWDLLHNIRESDSLVIQPWSINIMKS